MELALHVADPSSIPRRCMVLWAPREQLLSTEPGADLCSQYHQVWSQSLKQIKTNDWRELYISVKIILYIRATKTKPCWWGAVEKTLVGTVAEVWTLKPDVCSLENPITEGYSTLTKNVWNPWSYYNNEGKQESNTEQLIYFLIIF